MFGEGGRDGDCELYVAAVAVARVGLEVVVWLGEEVHGEGFVFGVESRHGVVRR